MILSVFTFLPAMQNFATAYFWANEASRELGTVDRAVGEYMLRDLGIDLAALGDAKDRIAKHFGRHRRRMLKDRIANRMLEWPLAEVQVMAAAEVLATPARSGRPPTSPPWRSRSGTT